eukprot:CAMPEP_0184747428 /NCGR_PEP_ID=MMETSP0315-20130426/10765_1 /TAXON_ID=101924 /ORGANISM="Rhodosorus marinus, Strain UTEX LB 2760" /LENGTH=51 /DNA_ID=CAMNT_0027220523 /DNA_START=62 /DNA_END=213 /DNA_ORIENTATION=+
MVYFGKESEHKLDEGYIHDNEHHRLLGVRCVSDLFHGSHDEDHEEAKDKKS